MTDEQQAKAMEIVRLVADVTIEAVNVSPYGCMFCGQFDAGLPNDHTADCPVSKARTILAEMTDTSPNTH